MTRTKKSSKKAKKKSAGIVVTTRVRGGQMTPVRN
jgi:hypothetical protein